MLLTSYKYTQIFTHVLLMHAVASRVSTSWWGGVVVALLPTMCTCEAFMHELPSARDANPEHPST